MRVLLTLLLMVPVLSHGAYKFNKPIDEDSKICLAMIVNNDAAFIADCLNSVREVADYIFICDMGSSDGTVEIIQKFLDQTGIQGTLEQFEQLQSRENKGFLRQAAKKMLIEKGFSTEKTYLLLLDANMKLHLGNGFRKDRLDEEAYLILNQSSLLSCYEYKLHLIKASLDCINNVMIHSYWSCNHAKPVKLNTLMISEQGSSAYRASKLEEDREHLVKLLENDPTNQNGLFYIGQINKSMGNYEDAINWYMQRVLAGGSHEQIWFSKFMIGTCYELLNQWGHALYWYLDAYQTQPTRAEPLFKLANYYRLHGQNELSYLFAKQGTRTPHQNNQLLFHELLTLDYQFDEELSIAAYYTPFKDDGYAASSDLLLSRKAPWYIKEQTSKNILFYIKNLDIEHFKPITIDFPIIREGYPDKYRPMNPSILKTTDGYQLICRTVNYTQVGAKFFNTIDEFGIFRTRNFLVEYDQDFNYLSQLEIVEDLRRQRYQAFNVQGLEDCRIFETNGKKWITCTTFDTNPTGNLQISLCQLQDQPSKDKIFLKSMTPLKGPDPYRCEKNWLPFTHEGELWTIYAYTPFTVYKPDIKTGECKTVLQYESICDLSRFRGSAAPIEFDAGYLMLVHEVALQPDYQRVYMHRFIYLDKQFNICKISKPFTFFHQGVEFCCSMTMNHSGSHLVIPIGIEDAEAYLCFVNPDTVRSLLAPLPIYDNTDYPSP